MYVSFLAYLFFVYFSKNRFFLIIESSEKINKKSKNFKNFSWLNFRNSYLHFLLDKNKFVTYIGYLKYFLLLGIAQILWYT